MPTSSATKKMLLEDIRAFCLRCSGSCSGVQSCTTRTCQLWHHRMGYVTGEADQLHLFAINDKEEFIDSVMRIVNDRFAGHDFSFSDIRDVVTFRPLSPKWWGGVGSRLKESHYVCGRKKSRTRQRNGAWENVWRAKRFDAVLVAM